MLAGLPGGIRNRHQLVSITDERMPVNVVRQIILNL
jgi:hypothetical protein